MQTYSSIEFNSKETMLMFDQELFPIKRMIIEKLSLLFQSTIEHLKDTSIHKQFNFPIGIDKNIGKISKGENHQQFPFIVLDFPKKFEQEHIFCFRNMFWFGHYFSSSLILAGDFVELYKSQFLTSRNLLHNKEIYFSMQQDPWGNEIIEPFSLIIETLTDQQIKNHIAENQFIKLTNCFVETKGTSVIQNICRNYEEMLIALSGGADSF